MTKIDSYGPLRTLWLSAALVGLPIVLSWELGTGGMEGVILAFSKILYQHGMPWLAGFMERLAVDYMTRGMLVALSILLVYAVLQLAGAMLDRKFLRQETPNNRTSAFAGVFAALTGRPRRLPRLLSTMNAQHDHNDLDVLHFNYGRHVLLTPLRLALWAFPVVGFLGTVMGISGAVAHLPQVLEDNARLNQLLNNLHVAFDTTFVGLTASLFIMAALAILDFSWDRNEIIMQRSKMAESAKEEVTPERTPCPEQFASSDSDSIT